MTRQWAAGDVAVDGGGNRLLAARRANGSLVWQNAFGGFYQIDGLIEDARPLLVIDPESLIRDNEVDEGWRVWELINCLRRIAEADGDGCTWRARLVSRIADEAEKQLRSPKPAEPTDPRAHVTDRRENVWRLLADGDWVCTSGPDVGEYLVWAKLAAERGPLEVEVTP